MQVNMNVEVGYVHIHVGMALPEDLICIEVHMYVCMYIHVQCTTAHDHILFMLASTAQCNMHV